MALSDSELTISLYLVGLWPLDFSQIVVDLSAVSLPATAAGKVAHTSLVLSLHARVTLHMHTCEQVKAACREVHAWQRELQI